MLDDDAESITREVSDLLAGSADPIDALRELARRYGAERVAREARIALGSWRSRIELVADALEQMLGEGGAP